MKSRRSPWFACARISKIVQREPNTCRIPAVLFGPFGLIVLALRQQGGVLCGKNASNIPRRNVLRSFFGADFCSDKAQNAVHTAVWASILTWYEQKSVPQNLVWIALSTLIPNVQNATRPRITNNIVFFLLIFVALSCYSL